MRPPSSCKRSARRKGFQWTCNHRAFRNWFKARGSWGISSRSLAGTSASRSTRSVNSLHAYRERVCLIQFSTAEADYIIDPFSVPDLTSLAPIFSDPHIEKIFHAAEYDLLCLRRDFAFSFANIFDTMQAGRILGRKQAGLDRLLEEKLGITHSKHFQKADWGVRPLSRDLMLYAALDTHYLMALRDLLRADLEEKGLWQLAQEDFAMACNGAAPKPRDEFRGVVTLPIPPRSVGA